MIYVTFFSIGLKMIIYLVQKTQIAFLNIKKVSNIILANY